MSYWDGTKWATAASPTPTPQSSTGRLGAATLRATVIATLALGLVAGSVFAGNGARGGGKATYSGTIALAALVEDANGNGTPNHGDVVTFNIATNHSAPYVELACYQAGTRVLLGRKGYFESSLDTNRNFGLASGQWTSGAADCTASLVYMTRRGWSSYASTSFHVDG